MVHNALGTCSTSMADVPTERDQLEALFAGGGITSSELASLLGERPGALSRALTAELISTVGALRRGDFAEVDLRGFLISAPSHFESIFLAAKPRLEAMVGPTTLAVISPSPTEGRFALPAVVPRTVATAKDLYTAKFVSVHATVLNLEMLGGAAARFLLVHGLHALALEDFFAARAPALTGRDVRGLLQERLNLGFPEVQLGLLMHMFSAPPYLDRAGGTGLTLLACEDRGRCLSKRALSDVLDDLRYALPPYLTGRRSSTHLDYLGIRPVPMRFPEPRLAWRFNRTEAEAAGFLKVRRVMGGPEELSLSTRTILEVHDFERDLKDLLRRPTQRQVVLSVSDLPLLLGREDVARDERALGLHASSEDVAHAVLHAAMVTPRTVLEAEERGALVGRILRGVHKDSPELDLCMRSQVLFDLGAKGGLIEHATRATDAAARALGEAPEDASRTVTGMYVELFSRFYDTLEPMLRQYNAVLEGRERKLHDKLEGDLVDALEGAFLELDAVFPAGWPYPELERRVKPRVQLTRKQLRARFDLLCREGEVTEVADGIFKRVWGPSRFW